jgi:AGCS family alanine or glycine:cation symporter
MADIQRYILEILSQIGSFLWGIPMILLLFGTHLFLTFKTGGIQRYMGKAIKMTLKSSSAGGDISNFSALMVAMAATVGTGNIIGVGTAIALGGPGAVFWCWLTGVFGIATKYAEALLSVKYRYKTSDGTMIGGPMVVIERALKMKWLAVFFCVATICAAFGIGNMTQANSVSTLMQENFGVSTYVTGTLMALLVGLVTMGGIKWLSRVCEIFVPIMAFIYMVGCIAILVVNFAWLDDAVLLIVKSAFSTQAVGGGFVGGGIMVAMRYGMSRGLFSNESGMGSAPIVSAAAKTDNAVKQALVSSSATFWDTVIICALTGIVLVSSVLAYPDIDFSDGAILTSMAFGKLHGWGNGLLTIALLSFVFSTILGWSYYAERCVEHLGGKRVLVYFRIIWMMAVFVGCVAKLDLVWVFSDCANALMAIPNIVSLLLLSGVVASETKKYLSANRIDEYDPTIEH